MTSGNCTEGNDEAERTEANAVPEEVAGKEDIRAMGVQLRLSKRLSRDAISKVIVRHARLYSESVPGGVKWVDAFAYYRRKLPAWGPVDFGKLMYVEELPEAPGSMVRDPNDLFPPRIPGLGPFPREAIVHASVAKASAMADRNLFEPSSGEMRNVFSRYLRKATSQVTSPQGKEGPIKGISKYGRRKKCLEADLKLEREQKERIFKEYDSDFDEMEIDSGVDHEKVVGGGIQSKKEDDKGNVAKERQQLDNSDVAVKDTDGGKGFSDVQQKDKASGKVRFGETNMVSDTADTANLSAEQGEAGTRACDIKKGNGLPASAAQEFYKGSLNGNTAKEDSENRKVTAPHSDTADLSRDDDCELEEGEIRENNKESVPGSAGGTVSKPTAASEDPKDMGIDSKAKGGSEGGSAAKASKISVEINSKESAAHDPEDGVNKVKGQSDEKRTKDSNGKNENEGGEKGDVVDLDDENGPYGQCESPGSRTPVQWPHNRFGVVITEFSGRYKLTEAAYTPYVTFPNALHNDNSLEFGFRCITESSMFPISEKEPSAVGMYRNSYLMSTFADKALAEKSSGKPFTDGTIDTLGRYLRKSGMPPQDCDWLLCAMHVENLGKGHFQLVVIRNLRKAFEELFNEMGRQKGGPSFPDDFNLMERVECSGPQLAVVDSLSGNNDYWYFERVNVVIESAFILAFRKANDKYGTRSRAGEKTVAEINLETALRHLGDFYRTNSVYIVGPTQTKPACGFHVLTHMVNARRKGYLEGLFNTAAEQHKVWPEPAFVSEVWGKNSENGENGENGENSKNAKSGKRGKSDKSGKNGRNTQNTTRTAKILSSFRKEEVRKVASRILLFASNKVRERLDLVSEGL